MKINNTPPIIPPSPDDKTNDATLKPGEPNALSPPTTATEQISATHAATAPDHDINTQLPPPIELAQYAKTGSLDALQDKLLVAAKAILLSKTPEPAITARNKVIDLVITENFRTILTSNEQQEIADTLKRALTNDPIFCAEVDNMLKLAAHKLGTDNQP